MKTFAVFLYLLLKIDSKLSVSNFLNNLESSENVNYIYVFIFDELECTNIILKSLSSPIVVLKYGIDINYLNLPKFKNIISYKYYFNENVMAIIFINVFKADFFKNKLIFNTMIVHSDKILVVIAEQNDNISNFILKEFYKRKYMNVIFLNVKVFEKHQVFNYFQVFPEFKIVKSSSFLKETVENIKQYELQVLCNRHFPYSYCFKENDEIHGVGRIYHLIINFAKFINGTTNITLELSKEFDDNFFVMFDLQTRGRFADLSQYFEHYPLTAEVFSKHFDKVNFFIMVPKAELLNNAFYVTKPFSALLWASCLGYLLSGSLIISSTYYMIKKKASFWTVFNQLLEYY